MRPMKNRCCRKSGRYLLICCLLGFMTTSAAGNAKAYPWWCATTVYQIYPRSFFDSSGDGIGDLQGIIEKLDYIRELGFETIWISPFFKSPQQDFGYDISDYYDIAPEYGDMATCERLIRAVHQRGMKVVFDLVMNHTSAEHPWFKDSALSAYSDRADWYVWRTGKGKNNRRPPNNWKSVLGGSAWIYHPQRKQFYYAAFLPFQPDLNYYNPQVKEAMFDVVRFWLRKGVDGFRLDMFNAIYEDSSFQDNPFCLRLIPSEENPDGFFQQYRYNLNHEKSFAFATELRAVVEEFHEPERFLVGEVFGPPATLKRFCDYQGRKGLHAVFLFQTLSVRFTAPALRALVESFEKEFPDPFIPVYAFSNHDRKRSFSRLGESMEKARLLALFQFTVRGIPFTYYGEELGMPQSNIPMRAAKDPLAQRFRWIPQFLIRWAGQSLNRDECRTPMLWNDQAHAGFCHPACTPWLPVSDCYSEINVERQKADEHSLLNFYKRILHLRRQITALQTGRMEVASHLCSTRIFAYYRSDESGKYLVILNMSNKSVKPAYSGGELLLSTHASNGAFMQPWEGRLVCFH
ncbi:MAG: oligo-1,6-glucosidase [Chitinophagales bacterium]|nr:MAG: oligo-1,6-glucosidase [Chitinophagales bacterium]